MDSNDTAQQEVIRELREIRVLVNNLLLGAGQGVTGRKDDVEKLASRTSLDGEFGRQLAVFLWDGRVRCRI